ncbi:DUF1206 domain-containing protein [Luteolibacter arcticus]|uniref:DUF1206 domain-containing protein n=1 Tax=Luteolibacter arcticus TaxID=1581411 RepID=A0ABT3GP34_9BACT|nr:DUF1206 domain-containing protein [Luteolibacter arcticus]MCW1925272.1 DUF1206 domain-containing protein [Luteolibacter arcticus]
MSESDPKLRVVDDEAEKADDGVVRLKAAGTSFEQVQRLAPEKVAEAPERLESQPRDLFEGRSQEPGVEAILDKEEVVENVEQPWGMRDGRLAGMPYGWFVLIIVAVIAAGVWAVIQMSKGEAEVAQRLAEVREMKEDDAAEDRTARELVDRIERVVGEYLAADSVEKIVPLIRHPERVKPLIEAEWTVRPKRAMKFARLTTFQPATIPGGEFWIVRAESRDGEPQNLILEQLGDTGVRVDWETHVCHQPMEWGRYIADRPSSSAMDFRVWVTPDSYYSHEFSDAGRWRCYRITTKDSEEHLFGYALADSEVARELEDYLKSVPNGVATIIARLRFPAGSSSPRGVVIEKLVEPRWMYVTDPSKDSP